MSKKKLLQLMDRVEHIARSLKEIIKSMTPEERMRLAEKLKNKTV